MMSVRSVSGRSRTRPRMRRATECEASAVDEQNGDGLLVEADQARRARCRRGARQPGLAQRGRGLIKAWVRLAGSDSARGDALELCAESLDAELRPEGHQAFLQLRVESPDRGHVVAPQQILDVR